MIVCPVCNHHNPEHLQACQSCGAALDEFVYRACPACGALNGANALFCHRCLTKLSGEADASPSPEDGAFTDADAIGEADRRSVETLIGDEAHDGEALSPAEALPPSAKAMVSAQPALIQGPEEGDDRVAVEGVPDAPPPPVVEVVEISTEAQPPHESPERPARRSEESPSDPDASEEREAERSPAPQAHARTALRPAPRGAQETVLDIPSPLEGVQDAIPLETVVALPHRAETLTRRTLGETQRRDADLFQRIAQEPASLYEQAQRVLPRPLEDMPQLGRRLLHLLVLLAALVPLFTGGSLATWVQPGARVSALASTLGALPADARVLLSFDYDPAYAGELDPLAVAVTRQLVGRSVQMVAMSTRPGGVALAERVLAQATAEVPGYQYGQQYVILGYLPDQQAGLRLLIDSLQTAFPGDYVQQRALADLPITQGLSGVADFQHVVIFTDDSLTVRHWVEQVQSRTGAPLHALVTQRVAPVLLPYAHSRQLANLIGAAVGGAELESAMGLSGKALRGIDGYLALFMVLLLVVVITNAVDIGRARRSKRRS